MGLYIFLAEITQRIMKPIERIIMPAIALFILKTLASIIIGGILGFVYSRVMHRLMIRFF